MNSIRNLLASRAAVWDDMLAIKSRAERARRDFTPVERARWDELEVKLSAMTSALETEQRQEAAVKAIDPSEIIFDGDGGGFGSTSGGRYEPAKPLTRSQTFAGYTEARGLAKPEERELDFGRYVRGLATGDWRGAEAEQRAMSEGTGTAGGSMVPTFLSAQLIDLARNETVVMKAGAQVVPMETSTVNVAKWVGDPAPAWRLENSTIPASDAVIGVIQLQAKTLAVVTQVSRELVEDATSGGSVGDAIKSAFAQAFAVKLDYAALYGSGTPPEPRGIKNTTGVTVSSMGTNGAALTNFDPIIDAVGALQDNNEAPNAIVMPPRTQRALGKLKDGQLRYLTPPTILDGIETYATNQLPGNLTQGTSSAASDVVVGDFRQLIVGVRTGLTISVLEERYADQGQIAFLGWYRADVAVARPKAFAVLSGVL